MAPDFWGAASGGVFAHEWGFRHMRTLTMTPRIGPLVLALAAAGIAVAGCGGGDPSASGPTSPTARLGSQSSSPRPGASVAPSNAPPATGSAGSPGLPGATGDDKGGANGSGGAGSGGAVALPPPNGNTGLGSLPAGFPLPSGTMLGRIAVRTTDITAPMQVPDGKQAAAFWKKELPAAGYKVSSAAVKEAIGDIKFSGNGCKRGSDLAISGEQVAFLCRR